MNLLIKAILLQSIFNIGIFAYSNIPMSELPQMSGTTQGVKERKVVTLNDAKAFEKDMKSSIAQGNFFAAMILADFFTASHELRDGKLRKNLAKAKKYYLLAGKNGLARPYFKLADMEMQVNNYIKATYYLELAYKSPLKASKNLIAAASYHASITLEHLNDNNTTLEKSIKMLEGHTNNIATAEFLLANLYNRLNAPRGASFYLTKACTNPKASPFIRELCFDPKTILIENNIKREPNENCPECDFKNHIER
ncbi:MAG: hypothetical protein COB67_00290 [SAR324 cluster bacterium]|uniref:Sel1 repeat family protein n=1 Tax=SAR324 cluster bacterium TaxID=2024889 RepID=A0A2A4TBM7_9DELT|nr:MAG: hypothetical protein COB67_00290 [SAR324 cluster bacterium]